MSIDELRAIYESIEQNDESSRQDGSATSGSDEFEDNLNEVDDETTIEAEEKMGRDMSYEDEIALLKRESEMSVEELRQKYVAVLAEDIQQDSTFDIQTDESDVMSLKDNAYQQVFEEGDGEDKEEFLPEIGADLDDETTLIAEEKLGREISYEEEIALLRQENEMSIEELRAIYCNNRDRDDDESSVESNDNEVLKKRKHKNSLIQENKKSKLSLLEDEDKGAEALRSLEIADAKARNTMVSRPYLLSSWVKLREYQQVGLNWLVSVQTRRLNGILADEMGLGKTLQTISLLSYLAAYKGIWGPHLIVVPTSCIVNWEVEIKRFCPAFKVLCYYGSAKRRKELRQGWTKTNWHHIIITSYQLVVQDSFAFKRKKWYYMVLDEAHNIKNFQSQRWQTLINFNTQRRLLLTGTPLQNNLMELWSLLHFLMPHVFRSRKEFSHWFSNPMNNIIEGNSSRNDDLISRLHGIIRPFVLRRLKKDVETQMPGKYEHIVKCHLSRRQMFLYEEFMSRSSTRMAMQKGGNYMGMMNVLMQLRKVCNHPDLFEPRSIVTPFSPEPLSFVTASCVVNALDNNEPLKNVSSYLINFLWSFGCGLPSVDSSLKHDSYFSCRKSSLQIDVKTLKNRFANDDSITEPCDNDNKSNGLQRLLRNIWLESKAERLNMAESRARLNALRCDPYPFAFPSSTQDSVLINGKRSNASDTYSHISCTPTELLRMKRLQEDLETNESNVLMKSFVFYVPKAGVQPPKLFPHERTSEREPLIEEIRSSFRGSNQLFFPDKKLVQFDAGKLQILAELLRNLKQERHRVLIFTQMSKMLDILEAFLNLNGHTYLRLDGATGVDQRQRLMDRFNNDDKIFCFILSTRSGGLGINLTGADTVVFYDSDWNPAMDAQAQDRAHRIGQTRDVHIYRLVTEHTLEENILVKAKQKRHLDFLVMDEGKFHAAPHRMDISEKTVHQETEMFDVASKSGLRNILGVTDEGGLEDGQEISEDQFVSAMAQIEDEDDVKALRGAEQEAKQELEEFDENIQYEKDEEDVGDSQDENDGEIGNTSSNSGLKNSEAENQAAILEKEFQEWQSKLGADKASIDACLNPVERYALRFKEDIDPFYSMWYLSEQQRLNEIEANQENEWNIDMIEALKAEEEQYAIEEGDLLATEPDPCDLSRQRYLYFREKGRLMANKRRRKLTGENWCTKIDGRSNLPFWYNIDSGEATWDEPKIITELKEYEQAEKLIWNGLPIKSLLHIMEYLVPYPERILAGGICKHWHLAAQNPFFVRHVYPVEMGALNMDPSRMERYHYRTIVEALEDALPGDTIELGDGHYWINENELEVNIPLRFIGDDKDASHVVIEMSGTLIWKASKGFMEGITLRRPKVCDSSNISEILKIENCASLTLIHSAIDSGVKDTKDISSGCSDLSAVSVTGTLFISESLICNAGGRGIMCFADSNVYVTNCEMVNTTECPIAVHEGGKVSCDDHNLMHSICS
jgi:E1A-binding protein p400